MTKPELRPAVNDNLAPTQALDELFLQLISDLCKTINQTAGAAALQIIDLSSNFLSGQTHHLLLEFHKLYADNNELASYKDLINQDVDQIIQTAVNPSGRNNQMAAPPVSNNDPDTPLCNTRIGLAAMQRDLEKQIIRDETVRRHVLPVLESMQFEETLARSLAQTIMMWEMVIRHLEQNPRGDTYSLNDEILATLKSKDERALFYKIVLNKAFDEDHVENSDI
jgi:hypothetical protein